MFMFSSCTFLDPFIMLHLSCPSQLPVIFQHQLPVLSATVITRSFTPVSCKHPCVLHILHTGLCTSSVLSQLSSGSIFCFLVLVLCPCLSCFSSSGVSFGIWCRSLLCTLCTIQGCLTSRSVF